MAVAALFIFLYIRQRKLSKNLKDRVDSSRLELEQLQLSFSLFAPNEVVEDVIAKGISNRAERRDVTMLFADLIGFSSLSEELDPDVLVQVVNQYFTRMSSAITENKGHVAKFLGDGVFAHFGALNHNPWQANDAAYAALRMNSELESLNKKLVKDGLPTLAMGIGIHRGEAVAGVVGSNELVEFTVIGRNVNLASRIEGLTRKNKAKILITEAVRSTLDPKFEIKTLQCEEIKGMKDPVATFELLGYSES